MSVDVEVIARPDQVGPIVGMVAQRTSASSISIRPCDSEFGGLVTSWRVSVEGVSLGVANKINEMLET